MEFRECLLENIEMFVDVVRSNNGDFGNEVFPISEREMMRIKDFLQDDFRLNSRLPLTVSRFRQVTNSEKLQTF